MKNSGEFIKDFMDDLNLDIVNNVDKVIQSCNTCQNSSCRVDSTEKIGLDENGYPQGYECIGYINHNVKQKKLTYPHK